jgi:hypothetical protein
VPELLPIGRLVVRVAIRPSFATDTVVELRDRKRPTRAEDYYLVVKHGSETREAPIERTEVTRLLELLERGVAVLGRGELSLDGTGYEVECGDGQPTALYPWGNATPRGWEPLEEIVATLTRLAGSTSA